MDEPPNQKNKKIEASVVSLNHNPRILVIDDDSSITMFLNILLTIYEMQVMVANDGATGIELARTASPDIILLDLMMPVIDGWKVVHKLREDTKTADIPILVVSAVTDKKKIADVLESGADGYIEKPVTIEALVSRINSLLSQVAEAKLNRSKLLREMRTELLKQIKDDTDGFVSDEKRQFPLAEFSRITDGIIHDMRNGLGIIKNTISFMKDDLADSAHEKDIQKILRSIDFCEVVLRNLSALGGQAIMQRESVNLEDLVSEVCFMLENKLVDVQIVIDTDGEAPVVVADEGHMKQVFMNLIKNASEAMPDGGVLTCRFRQKNDFMMIEIQDTGHGISKENRKRLFHELFTTKERGYGIGLTVVQNIIERHGGKITVRSRVGKGTTFTLLLPVEGKK